MNPRFTTDVRVLMRPGTLAKLPEFYLCDCYYAIASSGDALLRSRDEDLRERIRFGYEMIGVLPQDVVERLQPPGALNPLKEALKAVTEPVFRLINDKTSGLDETTPLALVAMVFAATCRDLEVNAEEHHRRPELASIPEAAAMASLARRLLAEPPAPDCDVLALLRSTEVPALIALATQLFAEAVVATARPATVTAPLPPSRTRISL